MADGPTLTLNVKSLDKSKAFYKALGFRVATHSMGPMEWLDVDTKGSHILMFWKDMPEADAATRKWLDAPLGRGVVINIGVGRAKPAWDRAKKAKAKVDAAFGANPWGGAGFRIEDPDGYLLQVSDKWPEAPAKTAKKGAKKAGRKAAKKVSAKKPARKAAKKASAKKPARKAAKKAAKKAPKKATQKTAKKATPKAAKRATKK